MTRNCGNMTQTKYTPNPDIKFGRVVGKIIEIVPDGSDDGNIPDFYGAEGSVVFRPVNHKTLVTSDALFVTTPQSIKILPSGNIGKINVANKNEIIGVWLPVGEYVVEFSLNYEMSSFNIEVTENHTLTNPLDLFAKPGDVANFEPYSDSNPPWKNVIESELKFNWPDDVAIVDLYTGSDCPSDLQSRIDYTLRNVKSRCVIRVPEGTHDIVGIKRLSTPTFAYALYHYKYLKGFYGPAGPEKTKFRLKTNSLSEDQLKLMAEDSSFDPSKYEPMQMGYAYLDGRSDTFLISGIGFEAEHQPKLESLHPGLIAKGVKLGQPAPFNGLVFMPNSKVIVNNSAFLGNAKLITAAPPGENTNVGSQRCIIEYNHCEFSGKTPKHIDPAQPRVSNPVMGNNDILHVIRNSWMHDTASRPAYNDQNKPAPGYEAPLSTKYVFENVQFDNIANVRPQDVDNPGTLDTTYKSVIGFEDSSAEIRFSRCRFRHTTKESRGVIALTTVSSRNPDGGKLIIEDCQFEYTENPQLNGFATVMIDPNSKWWTRGYPHGVTVTVDGKELKLHVFPDNMKWPPTSKQISDAGLNPSEYALARRF